MNRYLTKMPKSSEDDLKAFEDFQRWLEVFRRFSKITRSLNTTTENIWSFPKDYLYTTALLCSLAHFGTFLSWLFSPSFRLLSRRRTKNRPIWIGSWEHSRRVLVQISGLYWHLQAWYDRRIPHPKREHETNGIHFRDKVNTAPQLFIEVNYWIFWDIHVPRGVEVPQWALRYPVKPMRSRTTQQDTGYSSPESNRFCGRNARQLETDNDPQSNSKKFGETQGFLHCGVTPIHIPVSALAAKSFMKLFLNSTVKIETSRKCWWATV